MVIGVGQQILGHQNASNMILVVAADRIAGVPVLGNHGNGFFKRAADVDGDHLNPGDHAVPDPKASDVKHALDHILGITVDDGVFAGFLDNFCKFRPGTRTAETK